MRRPTDDVLRLLRRAGWVAADAETGRRDLGRYVVVGGKAGYALRGSVRYARCQGGGVGFSVAHGRAQRAQEGG